MLYQVLLPLLALPWALGAPGASELKRRDDYVELRLTPPIAQTFCSTDDGGRIDAPERLAVGYTGPGCTGDKVYKEAETGWDMDDRTFIQKPEIKSFMPGEKDSRPGTYCLLKYDADKPNCIKDSDLFYIPPDVEPQCVEVGEGYSQVNWEKTYDLWPKCPTGCYDTELAPFQPWPSK